VGLTITQVDAFTDAPFAGNPAAVCLWSAPRDERWMQSVAREMNLSETAFLVRAGDGYDLRWFTPSVEVALCGHATLASAHVLWEDGHVPATQQVRFHTKSGLLTGDRAGEWIELDFPAKREEPAPAPAGLAEALGVMPKGNNQFDYLVEIDGAYQASPRGGVVRVRVVGDRVKLGGKAVTILRGELLAS
jgi:PhzF family phenazine biosynthesis protein